MWWWDDGSTLDFPQRSETMVAIRQARSEADSAQDPGELDTRGHLHRLLQREVYVVGGAG